MIDMALERYDYLLDFIRKQARNETEFIHCANKRINLIKSQQNLGPQDLHELKNTIKRKIEFITNRQQSQFFDQSLDLEKEISELEVVEKYEKKL